MLFSMNARWRTLAGLVGAAVVAVAITAFATSSKANASGKTRGAGASVPATTASATAATSCGANTGKPAKGTPIKVGAVVGKTGPANFSSASQAAQAYFTCVNANGGINGHPIQYIVEDDHWDPTVASTVAHQLVQGDNVVALVGSTSFVDCAANAAYYAQQKIVVIDGVGVTRECFHSPNIAPVNEGPRLSGIGAAELAKKAGAKSIACVSNVIPNFGAWACQGIQDWGAKEGIKVMTFLGKADASDAEDTVTRAVQSHADAIVPVDAAPQTAAYMKVGQQLGSGGPSQRWYLPTAGYNTSFPQTVGSYWDNKVELEVELAPLNTAGGDVADWRAVMNRYATGAPRDTFSEAGFLAARIFTATMLKVHGTITRAKATAALRAVDNYTSNLLCGPWYFGTESEHMPNHAGRIVKLTGTGSTGFANVGSCRQIPDPDLAPVLAYEHQHGIA
jgi:branched-chain amino acid transport system substrate-binding protein